jgi:hypothetical protein
VSGRKKRRVVGDVFLVPLKDGTLTAGQILDNPMRNVFSCSFYDERIGSVETAPELHAKSLIALLAVTRHVLDDGRWIVVSHSPPRVEQSKWPNERYRNAGWVGAKIYDAELVQDFLNAYFGLSFWDDYHDPNYLDGLLLDPTNKPHRRRFKSH